MTSSPSRSCLVSIYGPGNALAAMAAVRWHGRDRTDTPVVVAIVHPPTESATLAREIAATVERLVASQGWAKPILITTDELAGMTRSGGPGAAYREVLRRFRHHVGRNRFDEIYYAHDISSMAPELAMNAYPEATRITYGDALGSTFNKRYRIALAQGETEQAARSTARADARSPERHGKQGPIRGLRRRLLGGPRGFQAEHAELILPMDMTGDYLADKTLSVVPRQVVLDIAARCAEALPELRAYSSDMLANAPSGCYIAVLENYADARILSSEEEVAMYEAEVRRHAPPGATVLLKPHPLATASTAYALKDGLDADYVVSIMPQGLMRYPLELWTDLVENAHVITAWSYCALSLSYLYDGTTVSMPDPELIARYFPARSWEWMRMVDTLMREQLAALDDWDGLGVLWKGTLS